MILFHSLNFIFILKPDYSFEKLKIDLIRLYSKDFDNEEADEPIYNKINDHFLEYYFYFTKKELKRMCFFLDYSDFVSSYKNYDNYLIEKETELHGSFTTYGLFVDEIMVLL